MLKWFETFLVKNRMVYYGMESERIRGWDIEGGHRYLALSSIGSAKTMDENPLRNCCIGIYLSIEFVISLII